MGLGFVLAVLSTLTNFVVLLKLFVPSLTAFQLAMYYFIGFIIAFIVGIALDFVMLRLHLVQTEYLISNLADPSRNIPIGDKEILGYKSAIAGFDREINTYKTLAAINERMGLDSADMQRNISLTMDYKTKYEALLATAQESIAEGKRVIV